MKIDLYKLIGSVQERFYDMESFYHKYRGYSWYSEQDHDSYRFLERGATLGESYIFDLCQVLGFETNRVYAVARIIRKWEERHNWERSFPTEAHTEQILKYLAK